MTVKASASTDDKSLTLAVSGNFTFALHREFRDAYTPFTSPGGELRVNLAATTYMDSSALGMLMLLQEHAKKYQQQVLIESPQPAIRKVLEIASFDKLFRIV